MILRNVRTDETNYQSLEKLRREHFLMDSLVGLSRSPKRLSCKYFYDERGSQLFDQICQTDDYYVTATENAIMRRYASEMGEYLGEGVMLIELGSGSSIKTRYLLDHLSDPSAYVPVDIAQEHLQNSAEEISREYPLVEVMPVHADFTRPFGLPRPLRRPSRRVVYFPGSTIGNFKPCAAQNLLGSIAETCGEQGGLLIGVDLQKDRQVLERAYNDREGLTAEFNLNLLHRMNRELGTDIDVSAFEHRAFYNQQMARIEMYLKSRIDQTIRLAGRELKLAASELIHTEFSHKYTIDGFAEMAGQAGWSLQHVWTDPQHYFAVMYFVVS